MDNVYLSAQETEGAFDENLEVAGDITVERDTSVDGEIPAAGNVAFGGHANAKGSVKIFASSEGGSPFLQSTSFSQPFEETSNAVFTPFNPAPNSLIPFISPLFLRLNHIPEVFLSTVSYPICNPYLVTRIQTLEACDLPKTMLPGSIRLKLSTIESLPKVLIPYVDTEDTVCPMVKPVEYAFISCPKMVVTSPIPIRLGPFRSAINSNFFPLAPLALNVGNVASLQRSSLSITPSLACYPSGDLSSTNAVPINISNSHCNTEPVGEVSSLDEFDSVKDCNSKEETPVPNLHFSGIVPVAGSFRIAAKF
ncbi:hypothetical protein K1T71_014165 [Dendrolimus kikuchii]|uniref:Uncharacterized protein n=1 Tax=Dendrolimus kikuchii TaxID=765133 RepID=A0ACC1CF83_9NEOP|nr:hypothetical protein K1T71_014165 [Dendrolimus kikuchii]